MSESSSGPFISPEKDKECEMENKGTADNAIKFVMEQVNANQKVQNEYFTPISELKQTPDEGHFKMTQNQSAFINRNYKLTVVPINEVQADKVEAQVTQPNNPNMEAQNSISKLPPLNNFINRVESNCIDENQHN